MSDIKLSECLFVDLKTDAQRRDWFLLGRGVETGIIAPALQAHLVNAYSKIVESDKLIEQQQKRIDELEAQLGKINNKCVVYDLEPAQHESAIRDHLIKLGWTPPKGE